jgi:hypothetical protein
MSVKGHFLERKMRTALSISASEDIPVEIKVCLPSEATALSKSSKTIMAEAILL